MANRAGRIIQVVPKKYSHSLLFKNNAINCWGSNSKVRSSPRLLGFSASIAVFGLGAQFLRNDISQRKNQPEVWNKILPGQEGDILYTVHKEDKEVVHSESPSTLFWKNGTRKEISILNFLKLLGLITPVACSEDAICDCNANAKSQSQPTSTASCNSEEKQKVSVSESKEKLSAKCEQGQQSSKGAGVTSQPKKSEQKKPSNKSCNASSSSGGCSQTGGGIDLEALSTELGGLKQIDWVIESDLSHCHLIRQASQFNVDSVTRILTETASAYEDYHMEYRRLIKVMMDALEDSRKVCGADLEVIDCKLILIRSKLDEMKNKIQELDMFMGCLERLGIASAETAFVAHAEYASVAMSERLHSMGLEVKRLRDVTKEMERDMIELQSLIIVESGKSLK